MRVEVKIGQKKFDVPVRLEWTKEGLMWVAEIVETDTDATRLAMDSDLLLAVRKLVLQNPEFFGRP